MDTKESSGKEFAWYSGKGTLPREVAMKNFIYALSLSLMVLGFSTSSWAQGKFDTKSTVLNPASLKTAEPITCESRLRESQARVTELEREITTLRQNAEIQAATEAAQGILECQICTFNNELRTRGVCPGLGASTPCLCCTPQALAAPVNECQMCMHENSLRARGVCTSLGASIPCISCERR
jgi:hypothetical protein